MDALNFFANVDWAEIWLATIDTMIMLFGSLFFTVLLGLPLGATAARGHACMRNWIGAMPDAGPVLAEAGGHWHDYGKQARAGRKVGHATLRADDAEALAEALARVGAALGRDAQVQPVVDALRAR